MPQQETQPTPAADLARAAATTPPPDDREALAALAAAVARADEESRGFHGDCVLTGD